MYCILGKLLLVAKKERKRQQQNKTKSYSSGTRWKDQDA
jgi:hypothetical protein